MTFMAYMAAMHADGRGGIAYSAPMRWRVFFVFALALSGCSTIPTPTLRTERADSLALAAGWHGRIVTTPWFPLQTYTPASVRASDDLAIYIEGDGLAWLSATTPSPDPTPIHPLGLQLALAQPGGNAAYVARPCQYVRSERCTQELWTSARFAPEVVAATNAAIDQLKHDFSAKRLSLIGYSGGAAVAALVAARRDDVVRLVTVAGNLDHAAWTRYHRVTALNASLNPSDHIDALAPIRQWHFVGANDTIIAPVLLEKFADRFPLARRPPVQVLAGVDHHCCWVERWPVLWRQIIGSGTIEP